MGCCVSQEASTKRAYTSLPQDETDINIVTAKVASSPSTVFTEAAQAPIKSNNYYYEDSTDETKDREKVDVIPLKNGDSSKLATEEAEEEAKEKKEKNYRKNVFDNVFAFGESEKRKDDDGLQGPVAFNYFLQRILFVEDDTWILAMIHVNNRNSDNKINDDKNIIEKEICKFCNDSGYRCKGYKCKDNLYGVFIYCNDQQSGINSKMKERCIKLLRTRIKNVTNEKISIDIADINNLGEYDKIVTSNMNRNILGNMNSTVGMTGDILHSDALGLQVKRTHRFAHNEFKLQTQSEFEAKMRNVLTKSSRGMWVLGILQIDNLKQVISHSDKLRLEQLILTVVEMYSYEIKGHRETRYFAYDLDDGKYGFLFPDTQWEYVGANDVVDYLTWHVKKEVEFSVSIASSKLNDNDLGLADKWYQRVVDKLTPAKHNKKNQSSHDNCVDATTGTRRVNEQILLIDKNPKYGALDFNNTTIVVNDDCLANENEYKCEYDPTSEMHSFVRFICDIKYKQIFCSTMKFLNDNKEYLNNIELYFNGCQLKEEKRRYMAKLLFETAKKGNYLTDPLKKTIAALTVNDRSLANHSIEFEFYPNWFARTYSFLKWQQETAYLLLEHFESFATENEEQNDLKFDLLRLLHCYLEQLIEYLILYFNSGHRNWISIFCPFIYRCLGDLSHREGNLFIKSKYHVQEVSIFERTIELWCGIKLLKDYSIDNKNSIAVLFTDYDRCFDDISNQMKGLSIVKRQLYDICDADPHTHQSIDNKFNLINNIYCKLNKMVDNIRIQRKNNREKNTFNLVYKSTFFLKNLAQGKLANKLTHRDIKSAICVPYQEYQEYQQYDENRSELHTCIFNDCCKSQSCQIYLILQYLVENRLYDEQMMSQTENSPNDTKPLEYHNPLEAAIKYNNIKATKLLFCRFYRVIKFFKLISKMCSHGNIMSASIKIDNQSKILSYLLIAFIHQIVCMCGESSKDRLDGSIARMFDEIEKLNTNSVATQTINGKLSRNCLYLINQCKDETNRDAAMILLSMALQSLKNKYDQCELVNLFINEYGLKTYKSKHFMMFDDKNKDGDTLFHWFAKYGNIIKSSKALEPLYLSTQWLYDVLDYKFNFNGMTPLHVACRFNNTAMSHLLRSDDHINETTVHRDLNEVKTPLMIAIENYNIDMIDSIVDVKEKYYMFVGSDVIEIRNPAFNNYNGLQYFVHFFKNELSNVDNGKCLNVFKRLFKSLLESESIETKSDLVDYNKNVKNYEKIDCNLIESLINIINVNNNRYDNSSNPNIELQEWIGQLHFMYKNKQYENIVAFILEDRYSEFQATIDTQFVCPSDGTSLQLMKQKLQTDLSGSNKHVTCRCMVCNEMINQDATKASMYQCQDDVKHIICKECCIVNLLFVLCNGLRIHRFIDKFLEVVSQDHINKVLENDTLMHLAIFHKNCNLINLLIKHGFDGKTLLKCTKSIWLHTCQYGSGECLELLFKLSNSQKLIAIDIFEKDRYNGYNALDYAVSENNEDIVQYLLTKVYNTDDLKRSIVNDMDPKNYYSSNPKIFKTIVELKMFDPKSVHWKGLFLIHRAVKDRNSDNLEYVLANKLYPNINVQTQNYRSASPLQLLADNYSVTETARLLCEGCVAEIDITKNVLHSAVRELDTLKILFLTIIKKYNICDWKSLDKHKELFYFDCLIQAANELDDEWQQKEYVWLNQIVSIIDKRESFDEFLQAFNYVSKDTILKNMADNDTITYSTAEQKSSEEKSKQKTKRGAMSGKTLDGWIVGNQLAQGGFGCVYQSIHKTNVIISAIKFIKINQTQDANSKYNQIIANEIEVLRKIEHKNIVKMLSFNANVERHAMLVFECMKNGDLYQYLKYKKISSDYVQAFF